MLDRQLVKRLDRQGCQEYQEGYLRELDLANRRLKRLRNKQKQNPNFEAYDYYAGENVSIDIRIEEQIAILDELILYENMLKERINDIDFKAKYPEAKRIAPEVHQLSIYDIITEASLVSK
jgi:hypothetical protein